MTNPPPPTTWNKATTKAAVDWVAQKWIPQIGDQMIDPQAGIEWFVGVCAKWLRNGERLDIMKTIKAAERGDDFVAHRSLMKAFHDMLDADEMPPASLRAYASRADERLALHRGRGSHVPHEDLLRNIWLAILMVLAHNVWGLKPTRNRESRRPSCASVIAAAAKQRGIKISESRLGNLSGFYFAAITQAGGLVWLRDQAGGLRLEWTKNLALPAP